MLRTIHTGKCAHFRYCSAMLPRQHEITLKAVKDTLSLLETSSYSWGDHSASLTILSHQKTQHSPNQANLQAHNWLDSKSESDMNMEHAFGALSDQRGRCASGEQHVVAARCDDIGNFPEKGVRHLARTCLGCQVVQSRLQFLRRLAKHRAFSHRKTKCHSLANPIL